MSAMATSEKAGRAVRMTASARREQLLEVATAMVGERGFHDVSIEAIARAAGITRATVYQHFPDLHSLLEAVIGRETSRALAQVSETTLGDLTEGDPTELMLDSLRAYLDAVHNQPATWRLILMPPEGAPAALHESIASGRATVLASLTRAVRPALELDHEAPDAELTARLLSAISDEYARLLLTDPGRFPPDRLLQHALWFLRLARPVLDAPSTGPSAR
jgi:AcrR family transcriptional regulator